MSKKNDKAGKPGPPKTPPGPTLKSTAKMKPITARTLRGLGEKADAVRNTEFALVRHIGRSDASRLDIVPIAEAQRQQVAGALDILDIVNTPAAIPGRTWMEIHISIHGAPIDLTPFGAIDAAFWSESAADKFLWPYYEGMRIWDENYLPRLKTAFKDPIVIGVLHVGESRGLIVKDPGPARLVIDAQGGFLGKNVLTLEEFEEFRRGRR
jgi:hypothetical protein